MNKELFKLAKAFETLTDELDLDPQEGSLKDRLVSKLELTAQDMTGSGGIDPYTQKALQTMIDPSLKIDGILGDRTRAAIATFRRDRGIPASTPWGDVEHMIVKQYQDGTYVKNTVIDDVKAPKSQPAYAPSRSQGPYLATRDDSQGAAGQGGSAAIPSVLQTRQ